MASIHFPSSPLLTLFLLTLFPLVNSLSTIAISETSNQTLVCAVSRIPDSSRQRFLNCSIFPQRIRFQLSPVPNSVSGVVAGNGFVCALSSVHPSSSSVVVCWRFSSFGSNTTYSRVYRGSILKEFDSGNSHVCGLVNGTNSLRCWQWSGFNRSVSGISESLAVGEDFVCGLSGSGRAECLGSSSDYNVFGEMPVRNFSRVGAGFRHACGISLDGSMDCWGNGTGGRSPQGEFTSLALGENRSCAIRSSNGTVVCWGENGFGLPESLVEESFVALEAKRSIFCGVLTSNYSLVCWGNEGFNSNPLAYTGVVPGPCRPRNECACDNFLPNYEQYCDQGLMICQPCVQQPVGTIQPPAPSSVTPPPPPPVVSVAPPPPSSRKRWSSGAVAFFVVGCVGSFSSLLFVCIFLFSRYIKIRGSRVHDSGRLEEGSSSHQSRPTNLPQPQPSPPPVLEKKISHLISMGNGGHLEEFPLEVLLKATEDFSEQHKIGSGSFGSVYLATLDDDRRVAIKRADTSASSSFAGPARRGQEDKDIAFLNELEFLSRLNHKNLVRLLGYCEESNERVLVYEYMENGTLSDHLHKLPNSPLLSWVARIASALDAARGIEYLHEYAVPCVIHRDIKSSNILLDDMWAARVSDFGLSLLGPQDDESHLSLLAAGTMGYMDPEYYRFQVLTKKSDVYSFGILLLELLSGCKAIHKNVDGVPRNVVDYVVPYIVQDEIHRVLDQKVPPPTPFEIEAVAYVGYLAADCVALEGRDRPTMSEVVYSLNRALEACLAPPVLSRSTTASST